MDDILIGAFCMVAGVSGPLLSLVWLAAGSGTPSGGSYSTSYGSSTSIEDRGYFDGGCYSSQTTSSDAPASSTSIFGDWRSRDAHSEAIQRRIDNQASADFHNKYCGP